MVKIPGTEAHLHLPAWPDGFDVMECLYLGVRIKFDKKTGDIFVQVARPADMMVEPPDDEGQTRGDGA